MIEDPDERRLLTATDGALGAVGLFVGAIGPCLATIGSDLNVSLDTAGLTLAAMAGGSVTASAAVATRFHGGSQRRVAAIGITVLSASLLGLGFMPSFWIFIAVAALAGAGGGLADAGSHGLAASAAKPDLAVSKLNRSFAIGAMIGPAWAGAVLQLNGDRWIVFTGLAAATALAALLLATAPDRAPAPVPRDAQRPPPRLPAIVFLMSALLFLYVGAEIGLGGWITSATREAADTSILVAALVSSGYWGALWLGRAASGHALERGWRSERILLASIAGAGIGSVMLTLAGGVLAAGAIGALIAGFCFGPIWPAALAIGTRAAPGNAAATMVTLGNGGGVILPWVQGRILVDSGPRAGMAVSAALCAGMLALAAGALRRASAGKAVTPLDPTGPV